MHDSAVRLFVALYPPPDIAAHMLVQLSGLRMPEHRATPHDQVHLTLLFVGDVHHRDVPAVRESVERSASGIAPFPLRPDRLITLPSRGPSRLLALTTDAPAGLLEIHRRLVVRLARHGERRHTDRFNPHLTLCRFTHVGACQAINEPAAAGPFTVARVRLMSSRLHAAGARHEELGSCPLTG
ncbi:MAG: RNA 2',3'-cyclic phosphodiesterase [Phycisphaerae bacterium]|nr:RNA 2',3'-cyclic phosphodiesterase [Phycisphaerae bacterium]